MKIVFFIGGMQRGGAERVISILANDFCSRGWDVDIALLLKNVVSYSLDERIRIVSLVGKGGSYVKNAIGWLKNIRRYLKQNRPDRVVSFVGRINALVLTAAMGLNLPIVVSERNDPKHDGRGVFMQWYCNRVYKRAKAVVFQNEYEKSCFSASLADISHVIPNPVSVAAVQKGERNPTVATAGRLSEQKNQAMLVTAMAQVHKVNPAITCRVYGEGALRNALQEQIDYLNLQDVVTLEGNVSDIHERLTQCGVFALTSDFEGLSNALIEAMMVGLPCVTTDYPGAVELIQDEKNGLVVPMNDADALAKAILKLTENKDGYADALAKQGQEFAQRFRAEEVLKLWCAVIEKSMED